MAPFDGKITPPVAWGFFYSEFGDLDFAEGNVEINYVYLNELKPFGSKCI